MAAREPPRVYGQSEVVLERESDLLRVFSALATRNTAGTGMNDGSSRSHALFSLYLELSAEGRTFTPTLQLVDLAGSERLAKSQTTGQATPARRASHPAAGCVRRRAASC